MQLQKFEKGVFNSQTVTFGFSVTWLPLKPCLLRGVSVGTSAACKNDFMQGASNHPTLGNEPRLGTLK